MQTFGAKGEWPQSFVTSELRVGRAARRPPSDLRDVPPGGDIRRLATIDAMFLTAN
jgi:hypothetical protein